MFRRSAPTSAWRVFHPRQLSTAAARLLARGWRLASQAPATAWCPFFRGQNHTPIGPSTLARIVGGTTLVGGFSTRIWNEERGCAVNATPRSPLGSPDCQPN